MFAVTNEKITKKASETMINIEIADSKNCNGDYSLFITFDYNSAIVEAIKEFPTRFWNKDEKSWELPFNQLGNVANKLSAFGDITISGKYIKLDTDEVQIPKDYVFKTKPFEHQLDGVKFGLNHNKWLLGDEQGLGKALALDTKVYTPTGYKLMRDISVGDYVFAKDGTPTRVSAIYNHHNVEMYRITFSDGVSVDCCKDHLWKIHDVHGVKVVDTKWFTEQDQFGKIRLNNLYSKGYGYKYWIDRCNPVQFEYQQVPVQPYVLGALLGDGNLTSNSIGFTTADDEMVKKINANLRQGYVLSSSKSMANIDYNIVGTKGKLNTIKQDLINLGLWKTNSHTKFVPDVYKYNSVSVRTQVLQGLIDTDGCASSGNLLSFSTVSKRLCDDVRFLVESLGGIVSCSEKPCGYNGKITGVCYSLTLKFDKPQRYCTLTRKRALLKDRHFKPRRKIVSIERIENADAKCITVESSEHLYIVDHFIVTHNTKQVIDIAEIKKVKHCLIVCCVNGLKWNWKNEVATHSNSEAWILGQRTNKNGTTVIGSNAEKYDDLTHINQLPKFIITNIETLRYKVKTGRKVMQKVNGRLKEVDEYAFPITERLQKLCKSGEIEMIAVDEAHTCKNPDAEQAKQILQITAPIQIAMTGTPLMNKPLDLYMPLKWLGYEKHGFWAFKNHHCNFGGYGGHEVVGYKHLEELTDTLDTMMLRRLKDEVLDLPEKTLINEYVEMGSEQARIYAMAHSDIVSNIDKLKMANNPLAELIRLRQATGNPEILSDVTENAKFDRMEELVDDAVENGKKVVIFSNWTQITNPAFKRLSKKYRGVMITGETKDNLRQEYVNEFQNNDRVKFIIGTIGALGTGLTLHAGSVEIFLDEPWNMALKEQAIDRCHRIGQKNNITVYTLLCKDTIDERINSLVEKKGQMSEVLIDGKIEGDKNALINYLLS